MDGQSRGLRGLADHLTQDLRYALRQLARAPGFAAVAVLTLALGIGATTTLYSVVHGVLLQPLPYPQPERLVRVFEVGADGRRPNQMSDPNFADLREQNRSLAGMAHYWSERVSVSGGSEPARVVVGHVSRDFFRVFAVEPLVGRTFRAEEQQPGAAPVALLSHGYWQRYLGGTPDLASVSLRYGDAAVAVIGVMPEGFDYPAGADLWVPRELDPLTPSRTALNSRVVGRLAADTSLEGAGDDLSAIARRLKARYRDDTWMADAALVPLREDLVGTSRTPLLLLLGASALLLLIACANVVNLLLARATVRRREMAVRVALGAGRGRLTAQTLTESLLLGLLGGGLGLLLARWGVQLLLDLAADVLPRTSEVRLDGSVLLFTLGLSIAVAVALGLLTAWRSTRDGVRAPLAAGSRSQAGGASPRLRGALVVAQVALTLMLLVGSGLLLRSLQSVLGVEPGYRTEGGLVLTCYLPYPDGDAQIAHQGQFYERLLGQLRALPGVAEVGATDALPLTGGGANGTFLLLRRPDEVTDWEGFGALSKVPGRAGYAEYRRATAGYFEAMRIPLVQGRLFAADEAANGPAPALVSESLAAETWPGESALGRLIQFGNMDGDLRAFTVVGVVGDIRDANLEAAPRATFYADAGQRPRGLTGPLDVVVVPRGGAEIQAATVRRLVHDLDPTVVPRLRTLEDVFADSLLSRRLQIVLLGLFAASALLLAVVGVYGLISFQVAQRNREIGVRIALGATGSRVVRLVLRQGLLLAGLGVALGLAGALAAARLLQSLLYGVGATDPVTFAAVPLLLFSAALAACVVPAQRAARVDPAVTLRGE